MERHRQRGIRPGRRYTSFACMFCRKRKVKCDARLPRCSNCSLYNNTDCVFGEDKRRTSVVKRTQSTANPRQDAPNYATREDHESNITHISTLDHQRAANSNNIQKTNLDSSHVNGLDVVSSEVNYVPTNSTRSTGPDKSYWEQVVHGPDVHSLTEGDVEPRVRPENDTETSSGGGYGELCLTNPEDYTHLSKNSLSKDDLGHAGSIATLTARNSYLYQQGTEHFEIHEKGPQNRLSSCFGRVQLAEDCQLHYYGAASNLHMIRNGMLPWFQPSIRTLRIHGEPAIIQAGLQWLEDSLYEAHLTELFFAWHNPFMKNTPLYSPTLANAILAVGAAYATRGHPSIPKEYCPSEFFAFRSRTFLDIEMDSPTLATVQALLILSAHEAAEARDSRGWLYSGMTVQLISDLGLHLNLKFDSDEFVENDEISSSRKSLFWAVQSSHTLWSIRTGRPSSMMNIRHNVPSSESVAEYQCELYIDERGTRSPPQEVELHAAGKVPQYLFRLSVSMQKILEVLYSGLSGSLQDIVPFVQNMASVLQHWADSLPAVLRVNTIETQTGMGIYLPEVIELNLQFHAAVILLYRPFLHAKPDEAARSLGVGAPDARQTCTESASKICDLLIVYRRQYGLRHINIQAVDVVLSAGLVHADSCCYTSESENKQAQELLNVCIQALGEIGQTFHCSTRALEVVTTLRRDWHDEVSRSG